MASESTPPSPASGGGARYAILGVALFAIAALAYCLASGGDDPPATRAGPADAGIVERSTALVEEDLVIPDPEPDAGPPPDTGPPGGASTKRPSGVTRSWDECTGDIPRAEASRVVGEFRVQIQNCYERQLKTNPTLEGTMTLAVRIAPDGRVDGTQVTGSLHNRDVFACVRGVAARMRFPAPGGRDCAMVQVPFNFTPRR